MNRLVLAGVALLVVAPSMAAEDDALSQADTILTEAGALIAEGRLEAAVAMTTRAIELKPDDVGAYLLRGGAYGALGKHELAIADYDKLLAPAPDRAEVYDLRGSEQFKLGRITESIADFDRFIELRPEAEAGHWKRGISYYYAGRFAEGQRQFEAYQTVDDNDVENVVWRYLCMARQQGVDRARAALLKVREDRRVPLMLVHALYRGQATVDDVVEAARAGEPTKEGLNERLFYADLYVGLYYEAAGNGPAALEHIARAAEEHKVSHYMGDVARVHAERLRAAAATQR